MSRPLSSQNSSIGERKEESKVRRSDLQLKKRQEMTESRKISRAALHMHLALSASQYDEVMQLVTHDGNWTVAWTWPRRRTAPTRASRRGLAKSIVCPWPEAYKDVVAGRGSTRCFGSISAAPERGSREESHGQGNTQREICSRVCRGGAMGAVLVVLGPMINPLVIWISGGMSPVVPF